jgi:uncharacterized SAM-binding protein YcdF (DUF218 family)
VSKWAIGATAHAVVAAVILAGPTWWWVVPAAVGGAVAVTAGTAALIVRAGRRKAPDGVFDAIVVPGAAVLAGGVASPALRRRVFAARALWAAGRAPRVVVSGGVVRHPPAEAIVARDLLVGSGVPAEAVVVEALATNTRENAARTAAIEVGRRLLVVTDDFHAARCGVHFRRHFVDVHVHGVPTATPYRKALREAPKLWASWLGR